MARRKKAYVYPAHMLRSTPAKERYCSRCQFNIISCLYEQFPLRLDPQPLNILGEIAAQLRGEQTYFVTAGNVYRRTSWDIQNTKTHGLGGAVHQIHVCGRPQPSEPLTNFQPLRVDPGF